MQLIVYNVNRTIDKFSIMTERTISDQQKLWDEQHATRGVQYDRDLRFIPNQTAEVFNGLLPQSATILEVGAADGRDARFWATQGHTVFALDFSQVALDQMSEIAREQGVRDRVHPILWDVTAGTLPYVGEAQLDGFYARSALHVDDTTMVTLAENITSALKPNGVILIEGKGPNDKKISRSTQLDGNLAIDPEENNHLRRIWTQTFVEEVSDRNGWNIEQLDDIGEVWEGVPASFMRFVARKSI